MSAAPGARGHACAVGPPASPARSVLRHVQLENLAAGLSGGVVSTLVLHPLDLVKIRFAGEAVPEAVRCCVSNGRSVRPDQSCPGFSLSRPRQDGLLVAGGSSTIRPQAQQLRCSPVGNGVVLLGRELCLAGCSLWKQLACTVTLLALFSSIEILPYLWVGILHSLVVVRNEIL